MKKIAFATLAVAGSALIAATAYAADGKGDSRWDRLDTNGDGEISASEMSAKNQEFFEAADADGNGTVSKEELKAHHKKKRAERREKLNPDANGDGVVDRAEFVDAAEARFDRMDKDGDGVLSEDEQKRRRGHHGKRRGDR